ncbi:MAG TPA: hypothetical protein VN726_22905 [Hanamia sp.]|nr:hypothetical protein [Hanamia sp.]
MFKFLGNFFKKVGEIFSSLTAGAEKVWAHYEPILQQALLTSSGIVALINKEIDQAPDFVFSAIEQAFPHLTKADIEKALGAVAVDLNLVQTGVVADPLVTLENIMTYLKGHTGAGWAKVSEFIANSIALVLAPEGTAWNKIGTIMWWVYQTFIKK